MAANTTPIFSRQGDIQWGDNNLTAANTAKDGTGTVVTAFTADATEGGRVESLNFQPLGTNVATAARIFINNGGSNTVATNNVYYDDVTLPATTLSEVASMPGVTVNLGIALPPGYRILCTIGTAVAAGYKVTAVGGKF